jgi:translocation and assembly module TamB
MAQAEIMPQAPRRRRWLSWSVLGLIAAVLSGVALAVAWLDTSAGHRFVAGRIAALEPASGLRVSVGGIEGSLFKQVRLHDVRLADPQGTFAVIREAELVWSPLGWFSNRLDIDRLHIPSARIERLPRLRPGKTDGRVLPDFDIRLLDLRIDRLEVGKAVAGKADVVRLAGNADIRDGRAIFSLNAGSYQGADAIRIALDSRPAANRFALSAAVAAPAGGIIAGLTGFRAPMALAVRGAGDWTDWGGRFIGLESGRTVANIAVTAEDGRFRLTGPLAFPGPVRSLARRLDVPALDLAADFTLADRLWQGWARLGGRGMGLTARGGVDLRRSRFDNLRIEARVPQLATVVAGVEGRNLALDGRLIGPFLAPAFDYRLTAPEIRQGKLVLTDVRVEGQGRVTQGGTAVPVLLTASALQVGSAFIDPRLQRLRAEGRLLLTDGRLSGPPIALSASGFAGRLTIDAAVSGQGLTKVALDGGFDGLEVPGLGRADVSALLTLANSAAGGKLSLQGRAGARMLRLDNGFLRGLGGGLPVLTTRLGRSADGRILLDSLQLTAPLIALEADGWRNRDGSFHFTGGGRHRSWGPLRLTLDGRIERPRIDLFLAQPADALGLADIRARLDPDTAGYQFTASGRSTLGPLAAHGAILLPRSATATIDIASLTTGDVTASGQLRPVTGGLDGALALRGPVTGATRLAVVDGIQTVALDLAANGALFAGPPELRIGRGTLKGLVSLRPGATGIDATIQSVATRYGQVQIGRLAATVKLVNGTGNATISATGQRGRLFDLQSRLAIMPERIGIELTGTVDQQTITLAAPAQVERTADKGWKLAPARLTYRGGHLLMSGQSGPGAQRLEARMERLPLALLDLLRGDLGLGGYASGTLSYSGDRGRSPTGKAALTIRNLTRSGLSLSSAPMDIGINATLSPETAALRLVMANSGKTVGRGQALLALPLRGTMAERLSTAPLRAQLRYAGAIETLWGLSRIEIISLGGNATLAADVTGTLADPVIAGTLATADGKVQSAATGLSLSGVQARGTFTGGQLNLPELRGTSRGGGSVSGSARFSFSAARGVGLDINLEANRALLIDRDDIGATVTGPLRLRSDESGGVISGDLAVVASRFQLGRASSIADIPQLRVIARNRDGEESGIAPAGTPWRLAVSARAERGLLVSGLGMESEWSANLRIGGTVISPSINGTADLVRGDYDFAGRRFALREGRLRFDGAVPVNPVLDIRAEADVANLDAAIVVSGTSLKPQIRFTSVPAMPQDELLARLLFGTAITQLSAPEAVQLAGAVAALQSGGGLDPINALRRMTGLSRLRILPADTTLGRQTAVAAGKYIGRRIYVELITDGQGYSATRIEYQITRWLSLLSTVSTIGRQSANARISKDY